MYPYGVWNKNKQWAWSKTAKKYKVLYKSLGQERKDKSDALEPFYNNQLRQQFLATIETPYAFDMFKGKPAYVIKLSNLYLLNEDGSKQFILKHIKLSFVNSFINLGSTVSGDEIIFNAAISKNIVLVGNKNKINEIECYDLLRPTKAHFLDNELIRPAINNNELNAIKICKTFYHV